MRRLTPLVLGLLLVVGSAVPALAAQPDRDCPNAATTFELVDPAGWWANTIDGFAIAGIDVYVGGDPNNGFTAEFDEVSVAFGFADGQAFYEAIIGGNFDRIDGNDDGLVCMKPAPVNPSNPGYIFTAIDNVAN